MDFTKFSDVDFDNAITHAAGLLKLSVKQHQKEALTRFLHGRDLFVNLPTGYGKSTIFHGAPLCIDFLKRKLHPRPSRSIAVVVSPITALIRDQISYLEDLKIPSLHLCSPNDETWDQQVSRVKEGSVTFLFASPEVLTSQHGKELLCNREVRPNVCGIFIDECHCIAKWGHSNKNTQAFRCQYGELADLRAFLPSHIPVVALTATATDSVKRTVMDSLALVDAYVIAESPNRPNIKYIVVKSLTPKLYSTPASFEWLIRRLDNLKQAMPHIIIYCRSHEQCNNLYGLFQQILGKDCQLFAMYHGSTHCDVQKKVVHDFQNIDGCIRLLFATIAFGMGVNVQGVNTIIHLGASMAIDDYMQESGRCGRDGKQAISVLISYPGMYQGTRTEDRMKQYVVNKDKCRRELLLEAFGVDLTVSTQPDNKCLHECCDICARKCTCDANGSPGTCPYTCPDEEEIVKHFIFAKEIDELPPQRQVSANLRADLRDALLEYRTSLLDINQPRYLAGSDLASGVPMSYIDDIVSECQYTFTFETFQKRYPFYDAEHTQRAWEILQSAVDGCQLMQQESDVLQNRDADRSSLESSSDEEDDEDAYQTIRGNGDDTETDDEYEHRLISSSSDDFSE